MGGSSKGPDWPSGVTRVFKHQPGYEVRHFAKDCRTFRAYLSLQPPPQGCISAALRSLSPQAHRSSGVMPRGTPSVSHDFSVRCNCHVQLVGVVLCTPRQTGAATAAGENKRRSYEERSGRWSWSELDRISRCCRGALVLLVEKCPRPAKCLRDSVTRASLLLICTTPVPLRKAGALVVCMPGLLRALNCTGAAEATCSRHNR